MNNYFRRSIFIVGVKTFYNQNYVKRINAYISFVNNGISWCTFKEDA